MEALHHTHKLSIAALKRDSTLFYAAFFMMVFAKAFGLYRADWIYYAIFALSGLLLSCRLVLVVRCRSDLMKVILIMLPCGMIFLNSRETTLLFTCLFLAASKNIDFDTCMKGACGIYIAAICLRVLLYFCGIVEGGNKPIVANMSDGTPYVVGYTYGYGYVTPNIFFAVVFVAILLLMYVKRNKLDFLTLLLSSLVILIVFWATKCKTGLIVYLALMAGVLLHKACPRQQKYFHTFCGCLIIASVLVGVILPIIHNPEKGSLLYFIDRFLSGRPLISQTALQEIGISILGRSGKGLDIMYMDVLLNCGIVGFAMVIAGGTALVWAFSREENPVGLICICALILYASMEQFPLNIAMNPFALYLGTNVLFQSKTVE